MKSVDSKTFITTSVALFGAAAYAVVSWHLFQSAQASQPIPEISWQRSLIIYNGIASVGFSCIGVLLGSSVQLVSLSAAKAEAAHKTEAIKKALDKLMPPGDLGGGENPKERQLSEARQILMDGLH